MDDKEFLELHRNITGFARGEQPVFSEPASIELPKLEAVENAVQNDNVNQPAAVPEVNQEQISADVDKAVDKYFNTDANNELPDDNELQKISDSLENKTTIWQDIEDSGITKSFKESNTFKKYAYNKEEVLTEAREISKAMKVGEDVILSSPEALDNMRNAYKVLQKEKDMDKVYEHYPELKNIADKDDSAAALILYNMQDVKVAHGIVENTVAGGERYWLRYQRDKIGTKGFYGEGITAEDWAKIKAYDEKIKNAQEVPDFFDAPLDNAVGKTVEQIAMIGSQYARGSKYGLIGAGIGYFGTKAVGSAVGAATGTGPLAVMATRQLAIANARRGMAIGLRIGGTKEMFDELAGQYYLEALSYKNKSGAQQFTENEARLLAGLQAGIETAIEVMDTEAVLKVLGKNPASAPAKDIIKNIIKNAKDKESAIALLKTEGAAIIAKAFKTGKIEALEEGKQQLATDLVGNYFAAYVSPDGDENQGLTVKGPQELLTRAGEATIEAWVPSMGMGVLGAGFSSVQAGRQFIGYMKLQEVMDEINLDFNNWTKNTNGVQMLRDLKEKFATTKLAQEHPEEAETLLKETLKGSGYENITVDTELFKKEDGGSEILYQLASAAGMTEEQAQTAIENNENITVSTEAYAKTVKDNPIADKLLEKISFGKEGDCLERCRKYAASMKHAWDKMIDAESIRKAEAAYNVLKESIGEDDAMDAMGIVELYPDDPAAGAKKKAQEQQQEIDRLLKPVLETMNKDIRKGVTEYYRNKETGDIYNPEDVSDLFGQEELANSGSFERIVASNNAQWYQNFVKAHGRVPTQTEMRQIAEDVFTGKNEYGVPGWEVNDIETEEAAEANARILANLKNDMAMYERLSEKLKNYDAGKVAAAEGLTESGYAAYKYLVDAISGAEMNKATQRSVAAGAMLWAHVAERYAEAYQAMGQDVTALDVIKRFKFSNREQGGGGQLNQQRDPYLRSRQENQNAIKDYYSGLEKLEDLAPEDISEAAEKVRFQNAEETRQECESFYQQIVNDGVEDPLGHKVTFVPTLHGKKVSIQEYVSFFIEKRIANSATVSYTKAVAFKNIADTISNPDAIIKGNDGKIQYVKIYEKSKGGILNKTVVTVDGEGNNQFYTMHMNNTKNKKSTLNEMKKVIQNADEILYIRGRQTGHPLHPTDQHASLTDANLHMSGTFILPQFYDSVNKYKDVLMENEKKLLSYSNIQKELQALRKKYKGIEFGSKDGLAPDGTETTLTETQWLLVRTKAFRTLFGDWELAYRQNTLISQSNPITVQKGILLKASQLDMGKKAAELIGDLPKDVMTENGNVRISKEGLADTFIHGLQDKDDISKVTNVKGDAVLSFEEGLRNAVFLDRIKDFKRKDAWDEYYAYWIEYDGEKMLVVCRVIDQRTEDDILKGNIDVSRYEENKKKKYLYVHEVYDSATLDKIRSIPYEEANAAIEGKVEKKASGNDMLQYVLARFINKDSNMKLDVLENGEPDLSKLDSVSINDIDNPNIFMQRVLSQSEEIKQQYQDTDQWLKAPNGKQTNLSEDEWCAVRTKAFKNWFGDWERGKNTSKVLDENGEPKVVYHGTNAYEIKKFKTGKSGYLGGAIYTTDTKSYAERYTDYGSVYDLFINIKNPLVIEGGDEPARKVLQAIYGEEKGKTLYAKRMAKQDRETSIISKADIKKLKDLGYDGIDWVVADTHEYAVYEPNQLKSAVKNNGNFDINNPNIFMQRAAVQEKNLVAYHNISEENLLRALESGGLPVPSIAITRKDIPFDNFGAITLVGTRDIIDPERGTDVYARDAYTVRAPKAEYKPATTKLVKAWEGKYLGKLEKLGGRISEIKRIITQAYNYPYAVRDELASSPELMVYYLIEVKGLEIQLPHESPDYQNYFLSEDKNITSEIEEICNSDMSILEKRAALAVPADKLFQKQINKEQARIDEQRRALEKFEKNGRLGMAAKLRERISKLEEQLEEMKEATEENFEKGPNGERLLNYGDSSAIFKAVEWGKEVKKKGTPVDWNAARTYMRDYLNRELSGYDKFVDQQMEELMGEPKLKVGNRYLPYTLENITNAMLKKRGAGMEDFPMNESKLAGVGAKLFKNIAEIRANQDKLKTQQDMESLIKELDGYRAVVVADILSKHSDFDAWGFQDEFNEALASVIKGGRKATPAAVKKALEKHDIYELDDAEIKKAVQVANNYREAATWYFEAKPQRAVGINEFAGAVVPETANPELIKRLQDMGLQVETYGIERTRQEATEAVQEKQDVLFQNTQGFIEFQQQGQYVVHLLETADESTFMHEMSHGFYDMMKQMAENENAPEQIKKDYETLRKWTEYNPEQINEYKGTATYLEFMELDKLIREAAEKGRVTVTDADGNEHTESYASLVNRWQQERFARGFEEYLRQGKAPSEGMRGIFSRFKNWLVKIYKGCIGVGAKPTEAVKSVMDRMIASQEEIDLAMKRAEILKWKEAGAEELLTKTSQEYYDNLLAKAREEAEAKVLKLAMKDLDAEEKAKYQAKLDKEREAATERIKQKPVFIIQQHLEQNPGLDVESVAKLLGNMTEAEYKQQLKLEGGSVTKAVDRYMEAYQKELDDSTKPGGEQYQAKLRAAAEEAVVTSKYTDLIAAYELQTYKKAVQRVRRLEKRLANIEAKDEAERQAAEASIRKEEKALNEQEDRDTRVQDLRKEIKGMKESIRAYGKNSQDEITQARYYANNRLDTLPVGEATDFRKWGNLAVRKHQDAMDMLNAGKLEEATKLQKEVLVYRMLEKRAYELNQKYEKKITQMAARSRTIAREHSMDANDTYLYNHLLYLFGLAEKDAPKPADFPGVQQQLLLTSDGILDENVPESSWISPDDWLLNIITGESPMKDGLDGLTMEQFREVEELMQYVYSAGKDRNSIKTLTDEEGNHITIEELNASIAVEAGQKRSIRDTRKNVGQDSVLEASMRAARKYKVELIKPETILQAMGESAMKYLYNPLRKCADNELRMNQELVQKQSALFAQYREDVIQTMGKKEGEKFLKDFSSKQQYVLGGMTRFKDSKLTHEELICLALNLGTEIGHKRVLDIYEMTEGKLRDLMYNLSGADWNLIQNIWDLHEEYWPALQKVTANVTGVTMEKQEAREFTIMSKDGVTYPIKGGYYHLAYDPTKNLKINEQKADERLTTQSGSNRRFGLGIGMTKERNQFEVKYALKLDLGVMQRALAETVHYISFYETVKDVNRLINTYEFAETVVSYFGEEHYQTLQKWVKDAWALEPENKTAVEQFNAAMRANQTMATLGFSMITAAENILNIAPMMAEIGPLNALKAVGSYYGQMFRTGLTNPMEMFDQNAFIAEHSIFMAERGESIDPNIHKAQADNGMNADNIITKGFKNTRDAAFYFITQTDLMLGRPLWMHEYQRVYNECIAQNMSPEVAERKAVQAGDAAVRHVFGSAADVDKADIQKKNSELVKFATMFYSYFSTVHNAMVAKGYEYQEQRHKGANMFQAAAPTLAWGAMMWYLIPAIGSAVMRAYLKGGDDDQEPEAIAKKIASTLVSNIFGGLPFARDLVPMAFDTIMGERTYGFRNAPMYEAGKQALTTVSTILKAVNGDKDVFDVMRSLARVSVYMSRFPLTATNAMITAAQWIDDSNVSDDEMAEYLRAMIMNQKPKK